MAKIICTQAEYDRLSTVLSDNPQFLKDVSICYDIVQESPTIPEELEHLYWYPTPDKKFEPEWEVINHEAKPGDEAWFERIYHCPRCKTILGRTCHSHYIFGHSSILQNNRMPNFCPHCGLMMTWYGTRLPASFLEEENYG